MCMLWLSASPTREWRDLLTSSLLVCALGPESAPLCSGIPWIYCAEIFPLRIRTFNVAITTFVHVSRGASKATGGPGQASKLITFCYRSGRSTCALQSRCLT
jgi:hypothetical protein